MNKTVSIIVLVIAIAVVALVLTKNKEAKTTEQADLSMISELQIGDTAYSVITDSSKVTWIGKKPGGEHFGTVSGVTGMIGVNEEGIISSGSVTVDLTTIKVEDLKDEEENKKLSDQLFGEDFLSVDSFPTAKFAIIEFTPSEENPSEGFLKGILTIKDISLETSIPVTIVSGETGMTVEGKRTLSRSDFGFGVLPVSDDFEIGFNIAFEKGEVVTTLETAEETTPDTETEEVVSEETTTDSEEKTETTDLEEKTKTE